jgi:porphobilinogen synthase
MSGGDAGATWPHDVSNPHSGMARRPRRWRRTPALRRAVRETRLVVDDLVAPLFVVGGERVRRPIESMPGQHQMSADVLVEEAGALEGLGVPAVILFGVPAVKDAHGSANLDPEGVVPRALGALKRTRPSLVAIADLCMCEYTDHGHCGIVVDGDVDNDLTLEHLAAAAVVLADAGADVVAPSGMMDGMVAAIRGALDAASHQDVAVLSYAAKYASALYGPFRDAAECAPAFGDRRTYQMDPGNAREALREMALDVEEGADGLMVKPAGPYLDILRLARERFDLPLAAYSVSGEYAMVKAAAQRGWLDEKAVALECLLAIKRAGADLILTYWAGEAAAWLREDGAA